MKNLCFLSLHFTNPISRTFALVAYTLLTGMSVGGYCMLLDFGAPKSEEIVMGVLVGFIVLAYVGFVCFLSRRRECTISEEQ